MSDNYQDTLLNVLDEIRAIAVTGLNFAENPYDRKRYERLLDIASINLHNLTGVDAEELSERFMRETGYMTPKIGVNAAVFDDRERILLEKRVDDNRWGLPSGWVEVGETLIAAIEREVEEETGLTVKATHIIDVYESKAHAPHRPHNACGILFLCTREKGELRISHESTDIGYFDINAVDKWHLAHKTLALKALNFIRNREPLSAIRIEDE